MNAPEMKTYKVSRRVRVGDQIEERSYMVRAWSARDAGRIADKMKATEEEA